MIRALSVDMPPAAEPEFPQDVSISDELLMNIQRLRRSSSPDLPSTVVKLETAEGCKVYLVGTAHFSKESQDDVAKVCCQYYFTLIDAIVCIIKELALGDTGKMFLHIPDLGGHNNNYCIALYCIS